MNDGARRASGEVLLFLHADTRLPASALRDIATALSDSRYLGGRFDVELEGAHWMLKIVGALINYRSRVTQVGTGDQALFVRREVFDRMGGFPDIPLMEDIAFCRALKRFGGWPVCAAASSLRRGAGSGTVSGARFLKCGHSKFVIWPAFRPCD